jgi:uncharacterized protein (DUF58 family)
VTTTATGSAPAARRRHPAQVHPDRTRGTLAICGLVLVLWAAVAHASGSEWVQAIGAVVAGIAVVGYFAPWFALRQLEVLVLAAPRDAVAGEDVVLTVVANRACRVVPARPVGQEVSLPAGLHADLVVSPEYRGVLGAVDVRLASAAPLGLFWWSGSCRLEFPHALTVAPKPLVHARAARAGTAEGEDGAARLQAEHGDLRGIREYRLGDSPRRIHWRASAHTGGLMVRESELSSDLPVRLVANLADDVELAESEAGELLGAVRTWFESRRRVILETNDNGRRVVAEVRDLQDAGRRLARAGVNPWRDLALAAATLPVDP